jgi:WD40 repeat protein
MRTRKLSGLRELDALSLHDEAVHAVVPAPDGSYILSAGADCRIRLWDLVAPHASRVLGEFSSSDSKSETAIYSNQVRMYCRIRPELNASIPACI